MRGLIAIFALTMLLTAAPAQFASAQGMPEFMKHTFPQEAVAAAWQEEQKVMNPHGALDGKTKHLIALGVAAQIPCKYCVYFHTKAAMQAGATKAEIKEAIAAAALTRKWSTVLNGSAYDFDQLKQEVNAMFAGQ